MTGAGVWSFTSMFLEMWDYITKTEDDYEFYPEPSELPKKDAVTGPGYIQPYSDSPLDHEDVGENVYLNLIEHAKKYVYIFTPYLILGPRNDNCTGKCGKMWCGCTDRSAGNTGQKDGISADTGEF